MDAEYILLIVGAIIFSLFLVHFMWNDDGE